MLGKPHWTKVVEKYFVDWESVKQHDGWHSWPPKKFTAINEKFLFDTKNLNQSRSTIKILSKRIFISQPTEIIRWNFFLNNEKVFLIVQHILNSPFINDFGTIENINQFNKLLLNHRTLTANKIFLSHFCPIRLSIPVLIKNSLKFQLEGNENRFVCKALLLWRKSAF